MLFQAENLRKSYGDFERSIPDLTVEPGTSIGLVGANGAGKTTVIRLVLDRVEADQGRVLLYGDDVSEATGWNESTGVVPRKEVSDRMVLNENGSVGALRRLCFGAFVGTLGRWAVATSCATSHVAIANDDGQRSRLVPK